MTTIGIKMSSKSFISEVQLIPLAKIISTSIHNKNWASPYLNPGKQPKPQYQISGYTQRQM